MKRLVELLLKKKWDEALNYFNELIKNGKTEEEVFNSLKDKCNEGDDEYNWKLETKIAGLKEDLKLQKFLKRIKKQLGQKNPGRGRRLGIC